MNNIFKTTYGRFTASVCVIAAVVCMGLFASCEDAKETTPVQGVDLDKDTCALVVGQTLDLVATVWPNTATDRSVTWGSNNTAVATVDANGHVEALTAGNARITVKTGDGGFTDTCTITVREEVIRVISISITPEAASLVLYEDETVQLTAVINPSNATNQHVEWFSNAPEVATVNADGFVTAQNSGTATITALTTDGNKIDACEVTVDFPEGYIPVESVTLNEERTMLMTGQTLNLQYTVVPSNASAAIAGNVIWESTNPNVVSVDENGLVTALENGQADIYITTVGENKTAYCRIFSVATDLLGTVSFRDPSKTWSGLGDGKVWSDVVVAQRCVNKTTFNGGSFSAVETVYEFFADCRSNTTGEKDYGHLFSWMAVEAFKDEMCPAPWRLPTTDDFIALDIALGGTGEKAYDELLSNAYVNDWGAELNGSANGDVMRNQGNQGNYWANTPNEYFQNMRSMFVVLPYTDSNGWDYGAQSNPRSAYGKNNGVAVRCVKDE